MTETLHPRLRRRAFLALALIPALALAAPAWAKPKKPSAQSNPCGGVSSPHLPQGIIDDSKAIAVLFGDLFQDWSINKAFDLGFLKIAELTGLDRIFSGDQSNEILDELHDIKEELDAISEQLSNMQAFNNGIYSQLIQAEIKTDVEALCGMKNQLEDAFNIFYLDYIVKGLTLGNALKAYGANPTQQNQDVRDAARRSLEQAKTNFVNRFNGNNMIDFSKEIHQRLAISTTDTGTRSLLQAYGQLRMANKRYLTSADSDALRDVYDGFAQVEMLAATLATEYLYAIGNSDPTQLIEKYGIQQEFELESLPKSIPEGVVIDLGSDRTARLVGNAHNKPIWFVPSIDAQCWQPSQTSTFRFPHVGTVFPVCDEVGSVLAALNELRPGDVLGPGWGVPSMVQLTALMSEQCLANPADPTKFLAGKAQCSSPLGGNGTNTVRDYLKSLNPTLPWQLAFCDPKRDPGCPEKNHVWTQDFKIQRFRCGRELAPPWSYTARDYRMRTGYSLSATNTNDLAGLGRCSWWSDACSGGTNVPGFPLLPKDFPGYDGRTNDDNSHWECDRYVWEMYFGAAPGQDGKIYFRVPSPDRRGVLIATRYTGDFDLRPTLQAGSIDYMAQTVH